MKIEDLNKQQIILLAILVAFVASIATGITVVTLMQQTPQTIATPINKIIRQTVEYVAPTEETKQKAALSDEEIRLLNQLKTVGSFVATVSVKTNKDTTKIIGNGLFFGKNQVIVTPALKELKEGEEYIVDSIFGEQFVSKYTTSAEYSVLELVVENEVIIDDTATDTELDPNAGNTTNTSDIPPEVNPTP